MLVVQNMCAAAAASLEALFARGPGKPLHDLCEHLNNIISCNNSRCTLASLAAGRQAPQNAYRERSCHLHSSGILQQTWCWSVERSTCVAALARQASGGRRRRQRKHSPRSTLPSERKG